jgi:hypothetical protein
LFVHVAAALAMAGALIAEEFALRPLPREITAHGLRRGISELRRPLRLGMFAMIALLISGVFLMRMSWGPVPWLIVALGLLALLPVLSWLTQRSVRTLMRAAPEDGDAAVLSDAVRESTLHALEVSNHLRSLVVLGIVFLMTAKPVRGVALVPALVVVAVGGLVALTSRRRGRSRSRTSAGTR